MPGRWLLSDAEVTAANDGFFGDPASVRRRAILRETIAAFESQDPPDRYRRRATANLARWRAERQVPVSSCQVRVYGGDWGEVTRRMTAHTEFASPSSTWPMPMCRVALISKAQ
jgi:hypothetical protein